MQIDAGISEVNVVTFLGAAGPAPTGTRVLGRRRNSSEAF